MTAKVGRGRLEGGGIEQKWKRTHGHAQQCGDLQGWRECIRGLNGNRKNTIKDLKKENT